MQASSQVGRRGRGWGSAPPLSERPYFKNVVAKGGMAAALFGQESSLRVYSQGHTCLEPFSLRRVAPSREVWDVRQRDGGADQGPSLLPSNCLFTFQDGDQLTTLQFRRTPSGGMFVERCAAARN